MSEKCSCQCGAESELRLDNGKVVQVQRLRDTLLQFQALGMPANDLVGDMLAERIQPVRPLTAAERPLYKAALLRQYARLVQPPQTGDRPQAGEVTQTPPAVEVFSKPGCPYTRGLRRKLEHDRLTYVEHDVQSDPAMLRRMLELNGGQRKVPTVRQGNQVTVGFHGM